MTGVPRDFLWLADSSVLLITDYAVSKRTPQGTWTTTSFPCLRSAQTGCVRAMAPSSSEATAAY